MLLCIIAIVYFLLPRFRFNSIIIHHTASEVDNYQTIRDFHRATPGWRDAAYHLILSNGKAGVSAGYLEATSRYRFLSYSLGTKNVNCNLRGIHLCLVGNYEAHPISSNLRPTVAHAIRSLQRRYGISDKRILFHGADCSPSACPGKFLSKSSLKNWIATLADQCSDDVKQQQLGVISKAGFSVYTLPWKMVVALALAVFLLVVGFYSIYLWHRRQIKRGPKGGNAIFLALGTVLILLCLSDSARASDAALTWVPISNGVEYSAITFVQKPAIGDGKLHVLRIDPETAKLRLFSVSEMNVSSRTAQDWCKKEGLVAAINAGMFQKDYVSNVGYMRNRKHQNNSRWHPKYKSVLAFGPRKSGLPTASIFDHEAKTINGKFNDYDTVIQNLRLLKAPGKNVWSKQNKHWSEAAIGQDKEGRILFLFCRTPLTMWEFNEKLRKLSIGIIRAMHVEGGPEASLSIHGGGIDLDLCGSFETMFNENNGNTYQWPIPNVVGIVGR